MTRKKPLWTLTDAEEKLWKKVTLGITKLDRNRAATPLVRKTAYRRATPDPSWFESEITQKFIQAPVAGLTEQSFTLRDADYNWQQKLRRGKLKPEGRIDLHGMTQDKAYGALVRYIEGAQKRGKRFILVITGKGGVKSGYGDLSNSDHPHDNNRARGVLKTNVPRWLSQGSLASRIVSYYSANAEHGGDGALYVVLKRIKK